jgi:hypothetical protein
MQGSSTPPPEDPVWLVGARRAHTRQQLAPSVTGPGNVGKGEGFYTINCLAVHRRSRGGMAHPAGAPRRAPSELHGTAAPALHRLAAVRPVPATFDP